jgi:chorismate mutase/prephenate dehydratase
VSSNAEAVRRVRDDSTSLAIAGGEAAKIYNLEVLEQGIEDQPGNTTRFFVVGNQAIEASGRDKTSLAISSRNRAGSLQRLLAPLADNSISMTRIESRPSRTGIWEYVFFIDFQGHVTDLAVTKALSEIESEAALFRVLGSYPQAI